jgi:hypothetical protein
MNIYSHDFAICPHCNGQTGSRIDHLYPGPTTAGPWACDICGHWFDVKINGPKNVELTPAKSKNEPVRDGYALLRFDGMEGPVFFIMKCSRYRVESDEEQQSSDRFFFEEHSCPTNWLRDCVEVISAGDIDPHGFLKFVRSIDVVNTDIDNIDWQMIFPEAFGSIEIEGSVENVNDTRLLK